MARSREQIDVTQNEAIKQSLDHLDKGSRDRHDLRHLYQSNDSQEEEKVSHYRKTFIEDELQTSNDYAYIRGPMAEHHILSNSNIDPGFSATDNSLDANRFE